MEGNLAAKQKGYLPGLDGIRALAVWAVLLYHLDFIPFLGGGFTGVDIFFVLSGYVISRSLFKHSMESFPSFLGNFYKRRVLRILPALLVCFLLVHLATVLFIPPSWNSQVIEKTGIAALFGWGNFTLIRFTDGYFSTLAAYNPFVHSWSLAIEEQFYLIFPLVFFLWLKFRKDRSAKGVLAWGLLPLLTLVSFYLSYRESAHHGQRAYYLLHSRFWELAAGALLFQFQTLRQEKPQAPVLKFILALAGYSLLALGLLFSDPWTFPFPWALLPVAGTLLLIQVISLAAKRNYLGGFLMENPLIQFFGRISYSLYLWHWPVMVLFRWTVGFQSGAMKALALLVSLVLSIASYYCIEKPIRGATKLNAQASWRTLLAGGLLVALGVGGSWGLYQNRETISWSVTRDTSIWNSWHHYQDRLPEPVLQDPALEGKQIFALGDSHTAAYRTMLHILSNRLGVTVHEYEAGDCDVAGLLEPMAENNIEHYENSLREIEALAHPGDIVFLAALRMPLLSYRFERADIQRVMDRHFSPQAQEDRRIALEEAHGVITQLEALGLTVLIDAPKPVLLIPPYRCSDWFNRGNPIAQPGPVVSADLLLEIRQPMMDSLAELQRRHPELQVWDPFSLFSDGSHVSAYDDQGLPLFYDGDHLSGHGNRMLAPSFEEKILEIWQVGK